jgi:flavodoxin
MHTLVIYESQFGNTEQIAQAITQALGKCGSVRVEPIGKASHALLQGVDLLVLGSPTQHLEATPDMLAWLDHIPPKLLDGMPIAVFDTRYHMLTLFSGSAAHVIGKEVQNHGGQLIVPPESFFVIGRDGPLEPGEVERALVWANALVATLTARAMLRTDESLIRGSNPPLDADESSA